MGPDRRPKSGHLLAVLTDVAYDPHQPRRSDGKWGSGGGSKWPPDYSHPGKAGGKHGIEGSPWAGPYDPANPPDLGPGIGVEEAKERLLAISPSLGEPLPTGYGGVYKDRITGLDLIHPALREQFVQGLETAASKVDPRLARMTAVGFLDDDQWRREGNPVGSDAYVTGTSINIRASAYMNPEEQDRYGRAVSIKVPGAKLPYSAYPAVAEKGLSPTHYTAVHEFGHVVENNSKDEPMARPMTRDKDGYVGGGNGEIKGARTLMPPASEYGATRPSKVERREPERWAEGFTHYVAGVDSPSATYVSERLSKWPSPWVQRQLDQQERWRQAEQKMGKQ